MRKNHGNGKIGRKILTVFCVKGYNADRFVNILVGREITVYDVKKVSEKRLYMSVSIKDGKKVFAIANDLCYNIKKVGVKGLLAPVYSLIKNMGMVIGVAVFVFVAILFSDTVFSVDFSGSGIIYQRQVREYLSGVGVKEFSRFSDFDLKELANDILANNDGLSFVGCEKRGNRLCVQLVLSKEPVKTLTGKAEYLLSDCNGQVESVKVYRGTAKVSVGQTVSVGDLLVDGYVEIKEQTVKLNVIATVSILSDAEFYYKAKDDDIKNIEIAELLATGQFSDGEILSKQTTFTCVDDGVLYKTILKYRRIITAG